MTPQNQSRHGEFDPVVEQLLRTVLRDPANEERLRQAVCVFTSECKGRGDPVERIVVQLKQTICDAHPWPASTHPGNDPLMRKAHVVDLAVRWCIEQYFDEAGSEAEFYPWPTAPVRPSTNPTP